LQIGIPEQSEWFGQVNKRAVAYAKNRSAELVTQIDDATRNDLRSVIADGLEAGVSREDIIDNIMQSRAFNEDRAELIASHEIRTANGQGRLDGYKAARDAGVKLKKIWVLGDNSCPECIENADAGAIDLDADFPGTETDMDPGHCNCDCSTTTEIEEESSDQQADDADDEE
jgi:hypothetical protein